MRPWRTLAALVVGGAVVACEPTIADCGDGAPAVGVFCFPDQAVIRIGRGFAPDAMAALDLDADGWLDVAAVNPSRATLSIHWGAAEGGERMSSWPLAQAVAGLAHGDLDGDGRPDLATALPDSDAVGVLYNRGARRFELRTHAAGEAPRGVLAARLDADGPDALITANVGDGSVSVLRRGVVEPRTIVGGGPQALAAGDLDGDGAIDVAVALRDDDAVQVLRNSGGALITDARHVVGATPAALVAGDLDGDGRIDLASADELGDTVSVIFGDGAGGARETTRWPAPAQPSGLVIVRGGGLLPVLGVLSRGTSTAAQLDPRSGALALASTLDEGGAIAAADRDRDGREELLHGGRSGGAIGELRPGSGLRVTPYSSGPTLLLRCALDQDGDGVDELVAVGEGGEFTVVDAAAVEVATAATVSGLLAMWSCLGVDLDGDGQDELLAWGLVGEGVGGLSLLRRVGEAWDAEYVVPFPDEYVGAPALGDVLGDGSLDLVVPTYGLSAIDIGSLWLLAEVDGDVEPAPQLLGPVRLANMVAIDLDGDAALDVAATQGHDVVVYPRISGDLERRVFTGETVAGSLVAGDLDGDGADDLLVGGGQVLLDILDPSAALVPVTDEPVQPLALVDLDDDGDLDALALASDGPGVHQLAALTLLRNDGAGGLTQLGRHRLGDYAQVVAPVQLRAGGIGVASFDLQQAGVQQLAIGDALIERAGARLGVQAPGAFADLDGDGRSDWFAAGDALALWLGRAGGLGPTQHVPVAGLFADAAALALDAAAGDLDGDGSEEIVLLGPVVADPAADLGFSLRALCVARVDADGGVTATSLGSIVSAATRVFVRDLDADGHADLLLVGAADGLSLTYLRGRGDGGFDLALGQTVAEFAGYPLALVAIDGDDRLDLLLWGHGGLRVARGQGSGNFDAPRAWAGVGAGGPFLAAELTGDGRVDLVTPTAAGLALFPGVARGLAAPRTIFDHSDVLALAAADLDADGARELLVVTAAIDRSVLLWQGRGAGGSFVFAGRFLPQRLPEDTPSLGLASAAYHHSLSARDLDGDGALDVVLQDPQGLTIVRQRP